MFIKPEVADGQNHHGPGWARAEPGPTNHWEGGRAGPAWTVCGRYGSLTNSGRRGSRPIRLRDILTVRLDGLQNATLVSLRIKRKYFAQVL